MPRRPSKPAASTSSWSRRRYCPPARFAPLPLSRRRQLGQTTRRLPEVKPCFLMRASAPVAPSAPTVQMRPAASPSGASTLLEAQILWLHRSHSLSISPLSHFWHRSHGSAAMLPSPFRKTIVDSSALASDALACVLPQPALPQQRLPPPAARPPDAPPPAPPGGVAFSPVPTSREGELARTLPICAYSARYPSAAGAHACAAVHVGKTAPAPCVSSCSNLE